MPNINSLLKQEISRVARKELRSEMAALKKASAQYRSDIAALKRQVTSLEKQIRRMGKTVQREAPAQEDKPGKGLRFSAKGFGVKRQQLGLSAADVGRLLGVTPLSVYKWEGGKAHPRASQLPGIAAFRKLGKREAAKRLSELAAQAQ